MIYIICAVRKESMRHWAPGDSCKDEWRDCESPPVIWGVAHNPETAKLILKELIHDHFIERGYRMEEKGNYIFIHANKGPRIVYDCHAHEKSL